MELSVKALLVVEQVLSWLLWPFYLWYERRQPRRIPYRDDALLKISAVQLSAAIRTGKIKSEKVVEAYINRIREVNPILNAVTEERFSAALEDARRVDATIASSTYTPDELQHQYPLLGVPITVKESCGLEGMSQAVGSVARKGLKATSSGEAVANLLNAGAIPLAVTTTPEYCLSWDTNTLVTGRTVNAYNTYRTSGGSSGGEGSLLGAGASLIGVGSDIAGSIRVPAHFNGIFGHKPTPGIISIKGHFPQTTDDKLPSYLVVGPMTRFAEDMKLMLKVMAGENKDKLCLDKDIDLGKIRIFFMEEERKNSIIKTPVQKEIKEAVRKAATFLRDSCKCTLSDVKFNDMENNIPYGVSVFFSELQDIPNIFQHPHNPKKSDNLWIEILKCIFRISKYSWNALLFFIVKETNIFIPKSKANLYKSKLEALSKQIESALGSDGILLYPTYPTSAFNLTGLVTRYSGASYTMVFNIMGFPCTSVPMGFDENNLPIGIQVVAGKNRDGLCLAVAEKLEKHFGGWIPPPMSSPLTVDI